MGINIQNVNTNDLSRIHELNHGAVPAVSRVTQKELAHFLEIADYFRVIKIENNIVGFLIALTPGKDYHSPNYKWFEKHYTQFMYIDRIVIEPAFQGQGLGKTFYDDLKIFSQGLTPILTCEVNLKPPNDGSILFHENYGFEQVGTQRTDGGNKEVSLMVYKISL
jgi:predicted GNAT superfamily acetyltransferase